MLILNHQANCNGVGTDFTSTIESRNTDDISTTRQISSSRHKHSGSYSSSTTGQISSSRHKHSGSYSSSTISQNSTQRQGSSAYKGTKKSNDAYVGSTTRNDSNKINESKTTIALVLVFSIVFSILNV